MRYKKYFLIVFLLTLLFSYLVKAEQDILSLAIDEIDHNFFSGEEIERTLLVRNDSFQKKLANIRWQILAPPAVIQKGEKNIEISSLGCRELKISLEMPQVKRRTQLVWKIQLFSEEEMKLEKLVYYSLFPRDTIIIRKIIAKRKIGILDPAGKITRIFEELKVPSFPLSSQLSIETCQAELVIISSETGSDLPLVMSILKDKVRQGMSVICFESESDIGLFPVEIHSPLLLQITSSVILGPGHPIFTGLSENNLNNWREDGLISRLALSRPIKGNFKTLLEEPNSNVLLLEVPYGLGKFIFCNLLIIDKFNSEPAAQLLLENLLRYGLMETKPMQPAVVYGDPESEFVKALDSVGVDIFRGKITDPKVVLICLDEESRGVLQEQLAVITSSLVKLIQEGGSILIFSPFNEAIAFLEEIVPRQIWVREYSEESVAVFDKEKPLLWGMNQKEVEFLLRYGKISGFLLGRAEVIVCQTKFKPDEVISQRTLSQLLTNSGVEINRRERLF